MTTTFQQLTGPYLDFFRPPSQSPIGLIRLRANQQGVTEIAFLDSDAEDEIPHPNALTQQGMEQLAEYFEGRRQSFALPLAPVGTPFQRCVWEQLSRIPYGTTCSYTEIATRIGRLKAQRAVGAANGRNPLAIVVPCHRVIGGNGRLTGYAGGLPRKEWLLRHEQAHREFALIAADA
ncbi:MULTISPECIES: methylated-DNA--[protein]-cysteine S-methyltransferase [Halomonadaceae]|uniref:methylated-DNA--[protein]-cysteine S-methyltransferase n=1 Tax=Halomonadaceae TaxID=28256 RepID=UPI00159A46FC|nr:MULTISPECIES: methylated-DNA--[protein]-cysteine S-methyltransferase [Halomonas]QJQ96347.1 methylated-DNA--[protein]-cysteine S-methyltransferase [Halomonas sp. PA5]